MKNKNALKSLMHLYLVSLKDAEAAWANAIDSTFSKISSFEVREQMINAYEMSQDHVKTLSEVLATLDDKKLVSQSVVMNNMIGEMYEVLDIAKDPKIRDSAFAVFQQCANHFKIAQYGIVNFYAKLLGNELVAKVSFKLLLDEKEYKLLYKLVEPENNEMGKPIYN